MVQIAACGRVAPVVRGHREWGDPYQRRQRMYRQGDVLVTPIDETELPAGLVPAPRDRAGRMVLARGEATGHAHVATGDGLTLLCLPDDLGTMFLRVRGYGRLSHEEHGPIPL